jgi:hypothetical protein
MSEMAYSAPTAGSPVAATNGPDTPESAQLIRQSIDLLMQAAQIERDDEDSAAIASCLAALQKILGQRAAEERKTLGDPSLQRVLGRG